MDGFAFVDVDPGKTTVRVDDMWTPGEWRGTLILDPGTSYYLLITPNADEIIAGSVLPVWAAYDDGIFTVGILPENIGSKMLMTMNLAQ